ncbi:MAG: glycerophosphodiester phosphodiesterase [Actinomycetota bacterium]
MQIIAHRGASNARRENTLPAFELAGAQGADGVELDVRRTGDHRLRVLHDPATSGHRPLVELDDVEVAETTPWVPTLVAALVACDGLVNVEIKDLPGEPGFDEARTTAHLVAAALADRPEPLLVSSFDPGAVAAVGERAPELELGLLAVPGAGRLAVARAARLGAVAVHPIDADVDPDLVSLAHDAGLAVNVWTVDDPDRIRELAGWGVDAVITNDPEQALRAIGR